MRRSNKYFKNICNLFVDWKQENSQVICLNKKYRRHDRIDEMADSYIKKYE